MTTDRGERAYAVFESALKCDPAGRVALLAELSASDPAPAPKSSGFSPRTRRQSGIASWQPRPPPTRTRCDQTTRLTLSPPPFSGLDAPSHMIPPRSGAVRNLSRSSARSVRQTGDRAETDRRGSGRAGREPPGSWRIV